MLTLPARIWRHLTRNHQKPPVRCWACYHRSHNHPAGPLHRYTTTRAADIPICTRHSNRELAEIMQRHPHLHPTQQPRTSRDHAMTNTAAITIAATSLITLAILCAKAIIDDHKENRP